MFLVVSLFNYPELNPFCVRKKIFDCERMCMKICLTKVMFSTIML